jgi:[ribosomal protein S5]-alanine N-acetyltransferase
VTWILETQRLKLREFTPADAPLLFALNSDPDVIRYTGDPPFDSIASTKAFIEAYPDYKKNGFGRWLMFTKDSNEFIGWCGLKRVGDNVDLGYRLMQKHWNKGYASEAAIACLDYGFRELNLQRIIGRVAPENKASIRVLEKMGMTFSKIERCDHIDNALVYALEKPR